MGCAGDLLAMKEKTSCTPSDGAHDGTGSPVLCG